MRVRQYFGMTLDERLLRQMAPQLFGLFVLASLGAIALLLNVIRAFPFRVQPLDPATLGAVAALILLLAVATSLRPALRAARVDLAEGLRSE